MKEKNKMKLRITLLSLLMTLYLATTAWAQNPHFVGKPTATLSGSDVNVCFKESGLGSNVNINYVASANATATYVCVNNGGQCPNAANKTTVSGPVATPGTFNSGKNGTISQCLTISPPGPGTFTCPSGQTRTLADVAYTNIAITDTTTPVGPVSTTPSSLSAIIFTCP
jgi:hypothetical protein